MLAGLLRFFLLINSLLMNKSQVHSLDQGDPLAAFRTCFVSSEQEIYLDGNSLGKLPKASIKVIENVVHKQWGEQLIGGWNAHWLALTQRLSQKIAKLLNAPEESVLVGESTSVNLYKIIHALVASNQYPKTLATDELNFPTDTYILEGICTDFSLPSLQLITYATDLEADINQLKDAMKNHPGIFCLSLVSYKSAYLYPMQELNLWAEQHHSIIVWDLSHAVGVVDIDFEATHTKAAIGCTYKYLNGGPGSPAFLFLSPDLQGLVQSPIKGWFGHESPFAFSPTYAPAQGIDRFKAGTPPILSLAAMEPGIDLTLEAGTDRIRAKSLQLGNFLQAQINTRLLSLGYTLESPAQSQRRGGHITLSHPESWRICKALLQGNGNGPRVIPDFRPPNYIRLGMAPLYIGFDDLRQTVDRLVEIVEKEEYNHFNAEKPTVT